MLTFTEYSRLVKIKCDFETLDFCLTDSEYCICEGSKPLLTPGGNKFSHPVEGIIRLILTDLQISESSELKDFASPLLFSFWKDYISAGNDPFSEHWNDHLAIDPFVIIKTSLKPVVKPFGPEDPLFAFSFNSLTGLVGIVNHFAGKMMSMISIEENESHPFPGILRLSYNSLSDEMKVAVQALSSIHNSGIVMPLLLTLGEISAVEYVNGLVSLKIQPEERIGIILSDVARIQTYLFYLTDKTEEKHLSHMIKEGEGNSIEFKSTLRWDIRAGKTNQVIERACLKTISAFLNSAGGTLLIGVRDDGSIEGIETDRFQNEDKFLLHLWTLIRTCLGRDFSPYIRSRIEKSGEKTICIVDCLPANRPVFLRQPGFDEEMYIRVGPSSNALDISEALRYIEDHFRNKQILNVIR